MCLHVSVTYSPVSFIRFFFQAEDGIRYLVRSRGLGDVSTRQPAHLIDVKTRPIAGFFRRDKSWDVVVMVADRVVGIIELKSMAGNSPGQNYNNRLSRIHIGRCRRMNRGRARWQPSQ